MTQLKPNAHRLYVGGFIVALAAFAVYFFIVRGPHRPQTPSLPLPYAQVQVSFANPDGSLLAGTLSLPPGAEPHPAIVLIPGSGPVERDGAMFGHQFYYVLADALTRQGFAVLRSDKRGLGQSKGNYDAATTFDFANDIGAAVAYLRTRADIDAKSVGLVGHSEGGLIASIVAGKDPAIAFVVSMAGNSVRGDVLLRERALASGQSMPPPEQTPWMQTFVSTDPLPIMQQVRCPILVLHGGKDKVVPPALNATAAEQALAGNARATVRRLPGLNHFFQTAGSGEFAEVAAIDQTMAPGVLELIGKWSASWVRTSAGVAFTPAQVPSNIRVPVRAPGAAGS